MQWLHAAGVDLAHRGHKIQEVTDIGPQLLLLLFVSQRQGSQTRQPLQIRCREAAAREEKMEGEIG